MCCEKKSETRAFFRVVPQIWATTLLAADGTVLSLPSRVSTLYNIIDIPATVLRGCATNEACSGIIDAGKSHKERFYDSIDRPVSAATRKVRSSRSRPNYIPVRTLLNQLLRRWVHGPRQFDLYWILRTLVIESRRYLSIQLHLIKIHTDF